MILEGNDKLPAWMERPRFAGDPVRFLVAFFTMKRDPQRAQIGFDHQDLQYLADVWEQAAIVSRGDEAFLREQRKFQRFCDDLKAGLLESKEEVGLSFLESRDWPSNRTIRRATLLLEAAEIRGIH